MKKTILLAALALISVGSFAQKKKKDKGESPVGMTNHNDSLSYSFGVTMANNIKNQGVSELNFDQFLAGVKETFEKTGKMTNDQANAFLKDFMAKKQLVENQENKVKGEKFLEANKSKEGVIALPSGLQYKVLSKGSGTQKPTLTDKVKTHYHGTLIDGTVFDSSVERGQPISFPVNGVIRGWVEALQLMVPGDKWEIYVPYDLAYGARATGKIKPFSTLIFTVELIEIEK